MSLLLIKAETPSELENKLNYYADFADDDGDGNQAVKLYFEEVMEQYPLIDYMYPIEADKAIKVQIWERFRGLNITFLKKKLWELLNSDTYGTRWKGYAIQIVYTITTPKKVYNNIMLRMYKSLLSVLYNVTPAYQSKEFLTFEAPNIGGELVLAMGTYPSKSFTFNAEGKPEYDDQQFFTWLPIMYNGHYLPVLRFDFDEPNHVVEAYLTSSDEAISVERLKCYVEGYRYQSLNAGLLFPHKKNYTFTTPLGEAYLQSITESGRMVFKTVLKGEHIVLPAYQVRTANIIEDTTNESNNGS